MKHVCPTALLILLLLVAGVGCVMLPTEELIEQAHICDANQGANCWDKVNNRMEAIERKAKQQEERSASEALNCRFGNIPWCTKGWRREDPLNCRCEPPPW